MKSIAFFLITFFCCSNIGKQQTITKFKIGKVLYSIKISKKYLHDDDFDASFFVVFKEENNKKQCSSVKLASRNDTIFIKGRFLIAENKLRFKQYYYYNRNPTSADSVETVFCQNKKGDLILKQTIKFKNGIGKITRY